MTSNVLETAQESYSTIAARQCHAKKIIIMLHYQHGLRCAESRIQMALQAMVPAASMLMLDL